MNIRRTAERDHKLRFLDKDKLRKVRYDADKRREKSGRIRHSIHEKFVDGKLPSAEWIKEGVLEFFREFGRRPAELAIIGHSLNKSVAVYCPEITPAGEWPIVSLAIVQGEFTEIR
jgi:hypothetical protein